MKFQRVLAPPQQLFPVRPAPSASTGGRRGTTGMTREYIYIYIYTNDEVIAPKSESKASRSPPGGWLQYRSEIVSLQNIR